MVVPSDVLSELLFLDLYLLDLIGYLANDLSGLPFSVVEPLLKLLEFL